MLFFIHFESRRVDIGNLPLGLAAIEKAKAIGAKTQRERDFINAMVAFYTELGRERKYAPFLARTRRRRAAKDGVGCCSPATVTTGPSAPAVANALLTLG